jgi:hypothetical protein
LTERIANRQSLIAVLTLVAVALLAAWQVWGPGMVNTRGGGDSPFLLQRTYEMAANLRAGVFPVRWMPDAAYGLGYPFFSYYAALPYYLAGLLVLLGLDILTALKVVQTLGFIAAALAMYGWMHSLTGNRWAAWLAAVAYTVVPFHLVNVYVRGDSLSEFYAFVFYPLVLWALDGISKPQVCKSASLQVAAVASAYAGLILTHNISALIFSPFALLYLLVRSLRRNAGRLSLVICPFVIGILSLVIGLCLSAWFWLPAIAELKYVQLGPSVGLSLQDYFHYSNHFRTLNLVQWTSLFDYSVASSLAGRSPFAMGLAQAAFAALGAAIVIVRAVRRQLETRWVFVLLGLLISTALITPLSRPLWDHLSLLSVVQFPWRFLSVQALFTAAVTGQIAYRQIGKSASRSLVIGHWSLVILTAIVLVASTLLSLHPDRLPIGPADVTVERLQLYELFAGNIGTTIRYEWLPNTANPRPFTSDALIEPDAPPRAVPLEGATFDAALIERRPTRQTWRVWGQGGGIAFPLLYWPGWEAQVDGEQVSVWPVEGSGYLALEVPPGEHTVVLRLGRTPVRAAAEGVSLVTAVALLAVAVLRIVNQRISESANRHSLFVICSLVIGSLLILLLLLPRSGYAGDSDLTMDFNQMPYLHHNPGGIDFGMARLAGYTLSSEELAPGDTLTVTLDWADVTGVITATVRLVSPAAVRYEAEPFAEATLNLQSQISVPVVLPFPEDIPRGIYLIRLEDQYLRPVRVPHGLALPADAAVLAYFGPAIRLHSATIAQPALDRLAVKLTWSAARPIAANYAISLRLVDAAGQVRVQFDTQPGYGFLPTSLWVPGELVTDRYLLTLPDGLALNDNYRLQVVLYQAATLAPLGQATVGEFALPLQTPFEAQPAPRSFTLPRMENPLAADFGGQVRLAGYDLERDASLHLTLWWQALQVPAGDYTVFVHLLDPATETIVAQSDAMPRGGAYPTSWWLADEVVSETVTLPLEDVLPGTYRLAVGLYNPAQRLPASGPDGQRLPGDRAILPVEVRVGP